MATQMVLSKTNSPTPLSYFLGANDISKIVDALLPELSPFFQNFSNDKKYVELHKVVLNLSKGKSFTNKVELDTIVKEIVREIIQKIIISAYKIQPSDNNASGKPICIGPFSSSVVCNRTDSICRSVLWYSLCNTNEG